LFELFLAFSARQANRQKNEKKNELKNSISYLIVVVKLQTDLSIFGLNTHLLFKYFFIINCIFNIFIY